MAAARNADGVFGPGAFEMPQPQASWHKKARLRAGLAGIGGLMAAGRIDGTDRRPALVPLSSMASAVHRVSNVFNAPPARVPITAPRALPDLGFLVNKKP